MRKPSTKKKPTPRGFIGDRFSFKEVAPSDNVLHATREQTTSLVLETLTKAVCEKYMGDPSTPSVLVSLLPGGEFYVSIVRYGSSYGKDKQVVKSYRHASLNKAIIGLARAWAEVPTQSAQSRLSSVLGSVTSEGDIPFAAIPPFEYDL